MLRRCSRSRPSSASGSEESGPSNRPSSEKAAEIGCGASARRPTRRSASRQAGSKPSESARPEPAPGRRRGSSALSAASGSEPAKPKAASSRHLPSALQRAEAAEISATSTAAGAARARASGPGEKPLPSSGKSRGESGAARATASEVKPAARPLREQPDEVEAAGDAGVALPLGIDEREAVDDGVVGFDDPEAGGPHHRDDLAHRVLAHAVPVNQQHPKATS